MNMSSLTGYIYSAQIIWIIRTEFLKDKKGSIVLKGEFLGLEMVFPYTKSGLKHSLGPGNLILTNGLLT